MKRLLRLKNLFSENRKVLQHFISFLCISLSLSCKMLSSFSKQLNLFLNIVQNETNFIKHKNKVSLQSLKKNYISLLIVS